MISTNLYKDVRNQLSDTLSDKDAFTEGFVGAPEIPQDTFVLALADKVSRRKTQNTRFPGTKNGIGYP